MKKLIGIFGDSWGCGEWCNGKISHKGIEQYFIDDGFSVKNYSVHGGSFNNTIKEIEKIKFELKNYDFLFYFQTDPIRNLRPYNKKFFEGNDVFNKLCETQNKLINQLYSVLNSYGVKFYLLGGCSKLQTDLIVQYKNLYPLIESVTEFLIPGYKHPIIWHSDWIDYIDNKIDENDLNQLLGNKKIQDSLFEQIELFWPDGKHPNKLGHKILYKKICEELKLTKIKKELF